MPAKTAGAFVFSYYVTVTEDAGITVTFKDGTEIEV